MCKKTLDCVIKYEEKPTVLVSACLLGVCCKYSGGHNCSEEVARLKEKYQLIPVCPEQLGGLMTPRQPSEIQGDFVIAKDGTDMTEPYRRGAEEAWKIAQMFDCKYAVLKGRSPSCGSGIIYDGTFTGTKIKGDGVTAALLKQHGILVFTEEEIDKLERQQ